MRIIAKPWAWAMLRRILFMTTGILAFLFPAPAVFVFTFIFAGLAFADGILSLCIVATSDVDNHQGMSRATLVRAVIGILIGLGFLLTPMAASVGHVLMAVTFFTIWGIMRNVQDIERHATARQALKGPILD